MYRFLTKTCVRLMAFCCVLLSSCDDAEGPADAFEPQARKLEGTFKITKAARNGVDMTNWFDFSAFRITFQTTDNGSGTYTIENQAPFLVAKNGNWKFDDATYPEAIAFTEGSETSLNIAEIITPVIYNQQVSLKFSPGCSTNVYEYSLTYVAL